MNIDIKKISELNEAIYNDNLLFLVEDQDGKGKKLKGVNFKEELKNTLVSKNDVLSLEEIMASTDLSNKVAGASGLKEISTKVANIDSQITLGYSGEGNDVSFNLQNIDKGVYVIYANGGSKNIGLLIITQSAGYRILYTTSSNGINTQAGTDLNDTITISVSSWYTHLLARRIA